MKMDKSTNNDLQNTKKKTKDRTSRALLKTHVLMEISFIFLL